VPLAAWFRGPLRRRLREALLGPGLRESGCSTPVRSRPCSTSTSPASATTALPCGHCRWWKRFCGRSTAAVARVLL